MRLLLHSHTYFFASFAFHAIIVLFLISGSIHFGSKIESFEATIEFVNPDTQKQLETLAKSQAKSEETVSSIQSAAPTLSSKSLDDLIRSKGLKLDSDNKLNSDIDKKQSDLLGYLRANKMTKETTPKKVDKANTKKALQTTTSNPTLTPKTDQKQSDSKPQQIASAGQEKSDQTTGDFSHLTPARRVWEKKKQTNTYRETLKKLITANWTVPPNSKKDFVIILEAIIDAEGNVVKIELLDSSGSTLVERAAIKAIRVSTPFPKIPNILLVDEPVYQAKFRFTADSLVR